MSLDINLYYFNSLLFDKQYAEYYIVIKNERHILSFKPIYKFVHLKQIQYLNCTLSTKIFHNNY